jgi:tetratricopeptide (TPR) repeat protein
MNPLAAALFGRALEGATGFFDWTDGRRRRILYLEGGVVALVQSNLRSESPEQLRETHPTLSPEALSTAVATARVAGALREPAGEFRWQEGVSPSRREPADLAEAVLAVGAPRPANASYLKVTRSGSGWFRRQSIPPALADYLAELDGTRTFDEVVSFAPGGPAAERWLQVGLAIGALVDLGIETSTYEVRNVRRPRAFGGGVDDIANLINEGLGKSTPAEPRATTTSPATLRFGPVLQRIRESKDHFATLGVTWQDPPESMRRAYFNLARELHPDRFVGEVDEIRDTAAELFDRVRAAWEVVGDDTRREAYIRREIRGEKTEQDLAMEKVRAILDAEAEFKRGMLDFQAGRLSQAHATFARCAAAVPEEAEFQAYAAFTTFRIHHGRNAGLADKAVARLKAAIEANDKLDSGWVLLGQVHHARGNLNEARTAYVNALRIRPSNPDAAREMRRLEREREAGKEAGGGLFDKLFGKK